MGRVSPRRVHRLPTSSRATQLPPPQLPPPRRWPHRRAERSPRAEHPLPHAPPRPAPRRIAVRAKAGSQRDTAAHTNAAHLREDAAVAAIPQHLAGQPRHLKRRPPSYDLQVRYLAPSQLHRRPTRLYAGNQQQDRQHRRGHRSHSPVRPLPRRCRGKDVWIYSTRSRSTQIYPGVLALILRVRGGQLPGLGLGLGAPGWAR